MQIDSEQIKKLVEEFQSEEKREETLFWYRLKGVTAEKLIGSVQTTYIPYFYHNNSTPVEVYNG